LAPLADRAGIEPDHFDFIRRKIEKSALLTPQVGAGIVRESHRQMRITFDIKQHSFDVGEATGNKHILRIGLSAPRLQPHNTAFRYLYAIDLHAISARCYGSIGGRIPPGHIALQGRLWRRGAQIADGAM
jgi:hypothetical protein